MTQFDAEGLLGEFERTGEFDVLLAAIEAMRATGTDLVVLSHALRLLGEETGDPGVLDDAARTAEQARLKASPGSSDYRAAGQNLALALWAKSDLTGESEVLERTVIALRDIHESGGSDPEAVRYAANFGLALRELFCVTGDRATLAEAISVLRQAGSAAAGHPDSPFISMNLALALQDWCEETGEAGALDEAIERVRSVVEGMAEADPERAQWASNLSAMYQDRYENAFDLGALSEAVRWSRQAVAATSAGHPGLPARLTHLGLALRMKYEATGDGDCLSEAVRVSGDAVDRAGADHPRIAIYESNYASALRFQYEHAGDLRLLDEAIALAQRAVQHTPPDHHRRAAYESNLALALWTRYERSGRLGSLRAAIAAARSAVAATSDDQPDLARYRTNLGLALWTLAGRDPETGALDESVGVLRAVLNGTPPGHAERARFAANLSNALWARFGRGRRPADLDEAIGAAQLAYSLTPADHVDHAAHAGNLGVLLLERNRRDDGSRSRARALSLLRTAVNAPSAKDFDSALHLQNLAEALASGPEPPERDLSEAYEYAERAAASPVAPVPLRVEAARTAARIAFLRADPEGAVARLTTAVSLLPALIGQPLDRPDQEHLLATVRGIASEAAAAALAASDPAAAQSLLEQGRGVLLRALTDPEADRRELRGTAPDLADRLEQISATAAAVPGQPRAGNRDGDRLLNQIRQRPGLARLFQAPETVPLPADLAGPVAVINLSEHRCDALLTSAGGIEVVPLRDLDLRQATAQAARLHRAVRDLQQVGRSAQGAAEADLDSCLSQVLGWLADTTVGPVLGHLAAQGLAPRRLWWSPTGPLAALPLHAAAGSQFDSTVMSYTPTLRALATAHSRRRAPGQVLVVDAADDLRSAAREVTAVTGHHPDALVLSGPDATYQAVTAAMPAAAIVHICAHGVADPERPSMGHIELGDRDLTIDEISRLALPRSWLTYLSACSTAEGSELLPDESLTIAAAFGAAGCPHVVASLWPVIDDVAAQVAELFHDHLAAGAPPAVALHQATLRLRASYPDHPARWTPYVHLGP